MHEVLVNCLGGLSLPRKSVVRLNDRPDMTLDVYRGHKTTTTTTILEGIPQSSKQTKAMFSFIKMVGKQVGVPIHLNIPFNYICHVEILPLNL